MPSRSLRKKRQRGGSMILMTIMTPLFMLPIVGLGIDGARGYIVQSKLSAAVDGAALGAGRLIGTNADTKEIAGEFLKTNFPNGYWGTTNFSSNIGYTKGNGRDTVTVTAQAILPLTFIRLLGYNVATVNATGIVTRQVTRVVMVLDRSGSMNNTDPVTGANVFTSMKASAIWFASQFTPGYDELGLVVFNGSGIVAYPTTRPWDPSPTGAGGPDKNFGTGQYQTTGPIYDSLNAMAVGGGTGTSDALALAYIELQKAHIRDLGLNGQDNVLNTIVLFTDGVPSGYAVYANDPTNNSLTAKAPLGTNTCTNNPATAGTPSTQMKGYLVVGGNPASGWGGVYGIADLFSLDTTQTLTYWLGSGGGPNTDGAGYFKPMTPNSAIANCKVLGYPVRGSTCTTAGCALTDLTKFPNPDLYGTTVTGNNYTHSMLDNGSNTWNPVNYTANFNNPTDANSLAAASWNAADNMANTIRSNNSMNQIQIVTIGYTGNGGVDIALLNSIANTPQSYRYDPTQYTGAFYKVNTTTQLTDAFSKVASSVMRLAQ